MIFTDSSQKCMIKTLFTLCQIAFVPAQKPYQLGLQFSHESAYFCNGAQLHYTSLLSEGSHIGWVLTPYWIYNDGQKSWDTFAFLGCFPIHTGPAPPLIPQTMLDACIQNFFRVSRLYRVGGGRTARNFPKGCTVIRGNREMTEKYEYCSTVPRTFVQDCTQLFMSALEMPSGKV